MKITVQPISIRSRSGVAEVLSTILAIPIFLILIGTLMYFGRALYAKAAIEEAASGGARWAATSLSGVQGCAQVREVIATTLRGYYLDPAGASVQVQPLTTWGRGTQALIRVSYRVSQRSVPILGPLLGDMPVRTEYRVTIDPYLNRYSNGWLVCGQ